MLPKNESARKCPDGKKHYYVPTSHIEASIGHVAVRFRCKNCGILTTSFLTEEEYRTNENILKKYGE
tara:strand:- start:196 stop:396 length:201 start_codon:yes stop_codon:yes gene_type:complete